MVCNFLSASLTRAATAKENRWKSVYKWKLTATFKNDMVVDNENENKNMHTDACSKKKKKNNEKQANERKRENEEHIIT